jgi:hypothetical protein
MIRDACAAGLIFDLDVATQSLFGVSCWSVSLECLGRDDADIVKLTGICRNPYPLLVRYWVEV